MQGLKSFSEGRVSLFQLPRENRTPKDCWSWSQLRERFTQWETTTFLQQLNFHIITEGISFIYPMLSCSAFLDRESCIFYIHKGDFSFPQWPVLISTSNPCWAHKCHGAHHQPCLTQEESSFQGGTPFLLPTLHKLDREAQWSVFWFHSLVAEVNKRVAVAHILNLLQWEHICRQHKPRPAVRASTFWVQWNIFCMSVPTVHLVRTSKSRILNS